MNKNMEVYRQALALLDTLSEGLQHLSSLIAGDKYDEALEMLYDSLSGIESVLTVLGGIKGQLSANRLQELEENMSDKFKVLTELFQKRDGAVLTEYLNVEVLTAFTDWKKELERLIMPLSSIQ